MTQNKQLALNDMKITKIQLTANSKPSTYLAYSPDNTEIIVAGNDSMINIYCAYTGELLERYGPHTTGAAISQVCLSPDQRYIAVALRDDKIIIHDRQQYQQYKQLDENKKKTYQYPYVIDLSQSNEEKNVISATYSKTILFDKQQKYLYISVFSYEESVTQLRKYTFPDLQIVKSINLESDARDTTLSFDDQIIYIAQETGFSYYKTENLELIDSEELGSVVNDLTWFRKQFLVIPCYNLQKVIIFDTKEAINGNIEDVYDINCYNYLNTAAIFDDPKYNLLIVGGGIDAKLVAQTKEGNKTATEIFDMITKQVLFSKVYHGSPLIKVRISSDCQSFSTIAIDGTLYILRLNIPDYKPRAEWK